MSAEEDFRGARFWGKMKGALAKVAKSLGIKKNEGIVKLKRDVRTCEYEDVRVLWEILRKNNINIDTYAMPRRRSKMKKRFSMAFRWPNCSPVLCTRPRAV